MSALCHKCGTQIDEDELTLCGLCSKSSRMKSMADSNSFEKRFARIAGNPTLGVCAAAQCGEEADVIIARLTRGLRAVTLSKSPFDTAYYVLAGEDYTKEQLEIAAEDWESKE